MAKEKDLIWEYGQYPDDIKSVQWVFAPIARFLARIFVRLPFTPNQITALWGILMIVSALMFGTGDYWMCVGAAALWILCYSMDHTDGIVAKYKHQMTRAGGFLDIMIHLTTYPLLMFCIGWGVYVTGGHTWFDMDWFQNEWFIFAGVITGISMVLIVSATTHYLLANEGAETKFKARVGANGIEGKLFKNQRLFALFSEVNPLSFTNMMLLMLVAAILDQMGLFIVFYAIGYSAGILLRTIIFYRSLNVPIE